MSADAPVTRPDLDALPLDISPAITIRAEYENTVLARELVEMQAALAAERARADQAEQRIADAPHDPGCRWDRLDARRGPGACTCWKSAAPTAELSDQ